MRQTLVRATRIHAANSGSRRVRRSTPQKPTWRHYCELIRFRYHVSFAVVLLGTVTVTRDLTWQLLLSAAALYFSFNVLLYGGIYTLHAISDARLDRLHPHKRLRPVASGGIPVRHARVFGIMLLLAGLLTGYAMFPAGIFNIYIAVLLLNAMYSAFARALPYVEIAVNAATYPLRYLMGAVLAGGSLTWPFLLLTFLVAAGGVTLRRRVELGRGGFLGRPTLEAYTVLTLILIEIGLWLAIGAVRLIDQTTPSRYYIVAAIVYAALVLLPEVHEPSRLRWQRFWRA